MELTRWQMSLPIKCELAAVSGLTRKKLVELEILKKKQMTKPTPLKFLRMECLAHFPLSYHLHWV